MDRQGMDHVSTLCALGTLGAGAAGLAFGWEDHALPIRPGSKRKTNFSSSILPHRAVSQPDVPAAGNEGLRVPLFRRKTLHDAERLSTISTSTTAPSRQSSPGGRHLLQSRGDEDGQVGDKRGSGAAYWLRRMSSLSVSPTPSLRPVTPSASLSSTSATPMLPGDQLNVTPNKLVKRSSSHRVLSGDRSSVPVLRRPATSHQRSATLQQLSTSHEEVGTSMFVKDSAPTKHIWRPYFDTGSSALRGVRPRKRHTSGAVTQAGIRTISDLPGQPPILLLGTSVEVNNTEDAGDLDVRNLPASSPAIRQRLRRSLSNARARRRYVSEPVRNGNTASESPAFRGGSSPLSPMSHFSAFEVELPRGTPPYPSSPFPNAEPLRSPVPNTRVSRPKRVSVAPSDPNSITLSSDNETRVFTDDESMDFQSDTAFDSLATRATANSHSGLKGPQIETIFDESPDAETRKDVVTLEDLINTASLDAGIHGYVDGDHVPSPGNAGIGIKGFPLDDEVMHDVSGLGDSTPNRSIGNRHEDDDMSTPITVKRSRQAIEMNSSPPVMRMNLHMHSDSLDRLQNAMADLVIAGDFLATEKRQVSGTVLDDAINLPELPKHNTKPPTPESNTAPAKSTLAFDTQYHGRTPDKKASIFDWSEQQRFDSDSINGSSPRPKTVHGKDGNDVRGSRAPGRRGPSAMHLRSQSVPVQRESLNENELPYTGAKYGTWGLGNKGVSEEWNDDFEFDDFDDASSMKLDDHTPANGTLRGMKVPQAIIDRQDSVHGQFGQVQEFMLLVEELKRLRAQGSTLQLLDTESKQLWEDAESIINLATLNDDDMTLSVPPIPASPSSFDDFDEDSLPPSRATKRRDSTPRRSMSNPATPPFGRPRGESLAHAKSLLQNIQQKRNGPESSPHEADVQHQVKLPFDTQDLRELVVKANLVTRALKDIVRKAEGVAVSPERQHRPFHDPAFSQIFIRPDDSSPVKKPGVPKSRNAIEYLGASMAEESDDDSVREETD